jgi:hypothetical protein
MSLVGLAWFGTVASAVSSGFQLYKAGKARNDAESEQLRIQGDITDAENSRQALTNPYNNPYENLKNPYENMSNAYANLRVSTKAAEIQMQETDTALANTLDTLRATGSSAGGATALAQAALKSKQGVAANLEQQEAQNEKLRAQGQMQVDQLKAQGQMQVEQMKGRGEELIMQGQMQMMGMQEARDQQQLDRLQGQLDQQRVNEATANQAFYGALGNLSQGFTSGIGNIITAGGN